MPTDIAGDNDIIYTKGNELDILAKNLVEAAYDEDETTRNVMEESVISMGKNEPKLLLSLILVFLKNSIKNKKVPVGHRIILLHAMKEILKARDEDLKDMEEFVNEIIRQVVEEMTFNKEVVPEWQLASSEVLVILSSRYCENVVKSLLDKLQPSVLPHFFVVQTLGSMASNNPYVMVPHLTSIITQMLTLLSLAKSENYRWVIANSFSQFCESIIEYSANPDRAGDSSLVPIGSFSSYMLSAFEIFLQQWINTKEAKLRKAVMEALGNMTFILERSNFESNLSKLISVIISQYKKHTDSYHVTKALSQILLAATGNSPQSDSLDQEDDQLTTQQEHTSSTDITNSGSTAAVPKLTASSVLQSEIDNLIGILFLQLQQSIDQSMQLGLTSQQQMNMVRNQNEVKRCFTTLCSAAPQVLIAFCLHKIDPVTNPLAPGATSSSGSSGALAEKQKVAALVVIRHLISCCDKQLNERRNQLISGLRGLVDGGLSSGGSATVPSNNVKMHLAHVIIAMGGQGYLTEAGGAKMVEFIVRHCALTSTKSDAKSRKSRANDDQTVTNEQLRRFCENVLHLGSSTVKSMRQVLWPLIMEMIVPVDFTEAIGTICCVVENLFSNSSSSDGTGAAASTDTTNEVSSEYEDIENFIDYDLQVNIPGPQFLMARLIVLAGVPLKNNMHGIHILRAMNLLVDNFHESLGHIWKLVIPKLIEYLEKTSNLDYDDGSNSKDAEDSKFNQTQWEELMLKLVAKSIEHINDEDWTSEFGEAMGQHIALYDKYPEEKGFLFKCLGTIMANSSKKTFIDKHLDLIYHSTKFNEADERYGFAVSYGICSVTHVDTVLTKLESLTKQDNRKSHGLFSFIKDKSSSSLGTPASDHYDKDLVRSTTLLAYANSIFNCPKPLLTSRLDTYVVKQLQLNMKYHKDQTVNRLVIESCDLIARSVDPKSLQSGKSYKFELRNDLITALLSFIESEPGSNIHSDIRSMSVNTIANLIVLPPSITNVDMQHILSVCVENIFSLPMDGIPVTSKKKELPFEEAQHLTMLMRQSLDSLNQLCVVILTHFFSYLTFNEIYKVICDKLVSDSEHVRERALSTLCLILQTYYDQINDTSKNGCQLSCSGKIIGDVIPRLADQGFNIRQLSVQCISTVLNIEMKMEVGRSAFDDPSLVSMSSIQERLKKFDNNIVFAAINDLSKNVCKKIHEAALESMIESLFIGLTDAQKHADAAVCVMLNTVFKVRHSNLEKQVQHIITCLHDILPNISDVTARTGILRAIKILVSFYLIESLNCIMMQALPLDSTWKEILCTIVNDESILDKALIHLMELMSRSMPFEERDDPSFRKSKGLPNKMLRFPCHVWLAALNCLQIILSDDISVGSVCLNKVYSRLFTSIILALGSTVICSAFSGKTSEKKSGLEANLQQGIKPVTIAREALENFLKTTQSHEIMEDITVKNYWSKFENEDEFLEAIQLLAKSFCCNKPEEITILLTYFVHSSNSNYEQHRLSIVAFYGAVVESTANTQYESMVDTIISQLVSRLADKSLEVRRLSLHGIGAVGKCSEMMVQRHSTSLLSALLMGMDDRQDVDDRLINAAMDGLISLLTKLTEKDVREVLVTVCLRMLSCYEHDNPSVRASAFRLFGVMAGLGSQGPSIPRLLSEIDSVLVPLLVHLEDTHPDVVRACKYTLRQIMPLYSNANKLTSSQAGDVSGNKLNEFIQSTLKDDSSSGGGGHLHYGEFCNEFAKLMTANIVSEKLSDLIMRSLIYFKSQQFELAASAVLLIGFLMRSLPYAEKESLQKGKICIELIQLLHSKNAHVRSRTAQAISLSDIY